MSECGNDFGMLVELVNNTREEDDDLASPSRSALTKEKLEIFVVRTVQGVIGPVMDGLVRKLVQEYLQSVQEQLQSYKSMIFLQVQEYLQSVQEQLQLVQENRIALRNCNFSNASNNSKSRNLQLKFLDKITLPVFTGSKIKGEGGTSIRVALVDSLTGQIVKTGPEAMANVEIVVLEGKSAGGGGDGEVGGYTAKVEDFNNKIVRESKGKKSLLKGVTHLKLKEGISSIDDLSFIHNSGWMKKSELCLGARAMDNFSGTTIESAKTESFILRDSRTTLYEKSYPPSLDDEVWRLKNIDKNGAFWRRLSAENIFTVKELLVLLNLNPQKLRVILKAGAKTWKVITDHAKTCEIDEAVHLYYHPNSQLENGVVFNVVGEVKGLLKGSHYFHVNMLSDKEKTDARKLVIIAREHWEDLIHYDNENALVDSYSRLDEPNRFNCENPPLINTNNHILPGTSCHGIISSFKYIEEPSQFDKFVCPSYGEPFSVAVQGSDDCVESLFDDFDINEYMQLGNSSDSQPEIPSQTLRAKRKWKPVFFVLKLMWFAKRRKIVSLEEGHVKKKLKFSKENTQVLGSC